MDGTLVDTEQLWWQTAAELADELHHPLTDRDAPEVLGQAVEHTAAHLHRVSGTTLSEAELADRLGESFAGKVAAETVPRPGALALLASLRDARVPTALVSASPRRVVDLVLSAIGRDWFAVTLAAEDTARTKPAPDPYLAAAERLGLDPVTCVAVEDTPTGVASATAAAARCWPCRPPRRRCRTAPGSPCSPAWNRPTSPCWEARRRSDRLTLTCPISCSPSPS